MDTSNSHIRPPMLRVPFRPLSNYLEVKAYLASAVFFSTQNVAVPRQATLSAIGSYIELLLNGIVSDAAQVRGSSSPAQRLRLHDADDSAYSRIRSQSALRDRHPKPP
ncbi:unnamed protein product [Heligmosomoides polygyrus]|uniref:Uncharacterized protein n=1 Tax=Heligmosomoides polygyrus TaxID=6339 RepID=A0A183GVR9_HELPZ|nr:unnamed protein product [Heligmosomoides polygyrus]